MNHTPPLGAYAQFSAATRPWHHPPRYGYDWFAAAIDKVWTLRRAATPTNWLEFERFSRDLLQSERLSDAQRCALMRDAIGAFTGRGISQAPETFRYGRPAEEPARRRPRLLFIERFRKGPKVV